jgi:transcriptional regulator with XRE-family HTH domain
MEGRGLEWRAMRYSLIYGPKRYVEYLEEGGEVEVSSHAEAALGGFFADPPLMRGRGEGHRKWSSHVALRAVALALQGGGDESEPLPWDLEGALPFPALRRLTVRSREIALSLPSVLGLLPGTRYLEGLVAVAQRGLHGSVVALDPGGDLSNWESLAWYDRASGKRVRVTTDPKDAEAVLLQTLEDRAVEYRRPPRTKPLAFVMVDPRLIKFVGRTSDVIDADLNGEENLSEKRHEFSRADVAGHLVEALQRNGTAEVARRTGLSVSTLSAIARGTSPRSRTVRRYLETLRSVERSGRTCAWEECAATITRPNQRFCSRAHADRAYRKCKKGRVSPRREENSMTCAPSIQRCLGCSALLLGAAATRGICRSCQSSGR